MRKGESIKGYKFLSKINRGACGEVWECEKDGKSFAIKCVPLDDITARMEETYAKRDDLNSPFLMKYYETFRDTDMDLLFIVMEICRGGDLSKTIKLVKETHTNVGLPHIMRIMIQSLLGLRKLHTHKLLHRDLKPQNMFCDKSYNIKLGDFGSLRPIGTQSNARTFIGTLPYISPEIYLGKPYNESADVWSLGVVLYQLAALELPWSVHSELEYYRVVVDVPIKPLTVQADCPQAFIDIVYALLQKDPAERAKIDDVLKNTFLQSFAKQLDLIKHFPAHLQPVALPLRVVVVEEKHRYKEELAVLDVHENTTIAEVKALIAAKNDVDPDVQNLVFAGLLLDDERPLSYYKLPLTGAEIYIFY